MPNTPGEIQEWAQTVDHDRLSNALKHRAEGGDPKAMMALSTNDEEALAAIEKWLGKPTFAVEVGTMQTAKGALSLGHMTVRQSEDNILVYGYLKNLKRRNELMPSFEMSLTRASAEALVQALNIALSEDKNAKIQQ